MTNYYGQVEWSPKKIYSLKDDVGSSRENTVNRVVNWLEQKNIQLEKEYSSLTCNGKAYRIFGYHVSSEKETPFFNRFSAGEDYWKNAANEPVILAVSYTKETDPHTFEHDGMFFQIYWIEQNLNMEGASQPSINVITKKYGETGSGKNSLLLANAESFLRKFLVLEGEHTS